MTVRPRVNPEWCGFAPWAEAKCGLVSIRIGTSGWTRGRGVFYPKGLPHGPDYASRRFRSIEINGIFYRLQWSENFAEELGPKVRASFLACDRTIRC
jgi:hypothetical protein